MHSSGFQTKAQMRYLLQMARKHPDKYKWVFDVLKDHGVPSDEGPLHTYWAPPYNVSPETPSYTYVGKGRRAMNSVEKILKVAQALEDNGSPESAEKLDQIVLKSVMIDEQAAKEVANMFWSLRKNEAPPRDDQEAMADFFMKFEEFEPYFRLNPATKTEAKNRLGDKVLGREID